MIPAPTWTPTAREYHADAAISPSRLKVFRDSPALYRKKFVTRQLPPDPPSPSMILGSIVNEILLRPETVHTAIHVCKCQARSAKEFKDEEAARPHQLVVTSAAWDEAQAIAEAIMEPQTTAAKIANKWLCDGEGFGEYAFRWDRAVHVVGGRLKNVPLDPVDWPIHLKMMLDKVRMVNGEPAYVELKTTADPSPEAFWSDYYRYGYHCQAAFNSQGLTQALDGYVPACYVAAVRNEEPHEVAVYVVPDEVLQDGRAQVETDLQRLAECYAGARPWASDWETLEADDGLLPVIKKPHWYKR